MLGNNNSSTSKGFTFLNFKDGKIVKRNGLILEEFDFIEGSLEKIFLKERDFNGERVLYWYVVLQDEKNERFALSFNYNSGVFKSVVLSLASDDTIGLSNKIRIDSYFKDGKTKVVVRNGTNKLDWVTRDLPPVNEVDVGGKIVKDESARMELISHYVEKINRLLGTR